MTETASVRRRAAVTAALVVLLGGSKEGLAREWKGREAGATTGGATAARASRALADLKLDPAHPLDADILAASAAVERDVKDVGARLALGDSLLARGYLVHARDAYREATHLPPELPQPWIALGLAERLLGNPAGAHQAFARAVKRDPRNPEAQFNLAVALEEGGAFEAAILHYKEALRLKPELNDPVTNPRLRQTRLLVPMRIALYLESAGGAYLPPAPIGQAGGGAPSVPGGPEAGVVTPAKAPAPALPSPPPKVAPQPAPTPILLTPETSSIAAPPKGGAASGSRPEEFAGRPGRTRRGGPATPPLPGGRGNPPMPQPPQPEPQPQPEPVEQPTQQGDQG